MFELMASRHLMIVDHAFFFSLGEQFSSGILWRERFRYVFDPLNTYWVNQDPEVFERTVGPLLPSSNGIPQRLGKLGMSIEGGGKRSIFAIGIYVKQRLLRPYHDWLMTILRRIPNDGTFDQPAPLVHLYGKAHCYSFDLKSATDRWPLHYLYTVLMMVHLWLHLL